LDWADTRKSKRAAAKNVNMSTLAIDLPTTAVNTNLCEPDGAAQMNNSKKKKKMFQVDGH
jgi:hypothetical protein